MSSSKDKRLPIGTINTTDLEIMKLIVKYHDEGKSWREISDILKKEHQYPLHFDAIRKRYNRFIGSHPTISGENIDEKIEEIRVSSKKIGTAEDLYSMFKKSKLSLNLPDVLSSLNCTHVEFEKMVQELRGRGYNIQWIDNKVELIKKLEGYQHITIPVESLSNGDWYSFGIVSDPHIGSKYYRDDVMSLAYSTFQQEGIKHVYLAGNIIDGHAQRINHFDLLPGLDGFTAQVEYLIEQFPKAEGITTHFITSECHEGWWIRDFGVNIGEYIQLKAEEAGRNDFDWIGHMEVDIELKNKSGASCIMRIVHPGLGSSYATSYSTQRLVESYSGGEKPAILLVGHFHKAIYHYERNVHILQCGCLMDQSPWMRKKRIAAHVGFWIVKFHQAKSGEINRFQCEWFPAFDRGYYKIFKTW